MSSEGGAKAVVSIADTLAGHPIGRTLIVLGILYMGVIGLLDPAQKATDVLAGCASLLVVFAAYSIHLWWRRRQQAEREGRGSSSPLAQLFTTFTFLVIALLAVAFGVFLLFRRRKARIEAQLPTALEIDELARREIREAV